MSKLGIAAVCILAVVFGLTGCGGKTNDRDQRDRAIEFTELEPTPSSCDVRPIGATVFGTTLIQYTTFDAPSSFLDIVPEYSTNGGVTFFPATQGNGGDGDILLEASPGGANHIFAWDSLADLPGSVNGPVGNIVFRVTPVENSGAPAVGPLFGAPCVSEVFTVENVPAILDLGSLASGLAQDGVPIGVFLTNPMPSANPTTITLDVVYDSTLITITGAIPGPAAPGGSMTDFMVISAGRVRVSVDTMGVPLNDGEIITLIADTACVAPRALPASSAIICDQPSATDGLANAVAIVCGAAGSTALIDNSSTVELADFMLAVGQPTEMVPVNYTNGAPSVGATTLSFSLTYDFTQLDIVGANAGPALDAGATVTFTGGVGTGSATIDIDNNGVPIADGQILDLLIDTISGNAGTTFINLGNLVQTTQGRCPLVGGNFASPVVQVTITSARTLMSLRPVHLLGATGTPQLIAGSDMPGNPKGNWAPINEGEFSGNTSLQMGGNPIIFTSTMGTPFQVVVEGLWSSTPVLSDVAPAMTADGMTTYTTLSAGTFATIDANGLVSPVGGNGCDVFEVMFTPNGVTAFGMPMTTQFAACVDLGGFDGLSRAGGTLPVGELDADVPGLPLGDPIPAAGGSFQETIYVNTGPTPVGAYQTTTTWDQARLSLDTMAGTMGYSGPSDITLGGPSVVNAGTPGQAIANHFTVSMAFSGIFDIWSLNFDVNTSGSTAIDHLLENLVSSAIPPVAIGAPTPRTSPFADANVTFP